MALSADLLYSTSGLTETLHVKLTASVTYYKVSIIQLDKTTGYAKKATDVANECPIGVLKAGQIVGAGVNPDAEVETGKIWIPLATAAQTHVGLPMYATDDAVVTSTPGAAGGYAGWCIDVVVGSKVLIDFRTRGQKGAIG